MEKFRLILRGSVSRNAENDITTLPEFEAVFEGECDAVGAAVAVLMNKQTEFKKIVEVCAQHSGAVMPNRLFFACETVAGENGKKRSKSELTGSREELLKYIVHKMKTEKHFCEVITQAAANYYASLNS